MAVAMVTDPHNRYFELLFVAKPGGYNPNIAIRHILKLALRRYGLKCVEARELGAPVSGEKPKIPVA